MGSTVIKDKFHTARIMHGCDGCPRTIFPGQKYRRLFGSAYSFEKKHELKLCSECTDIKEDGHKALILNTD